MMILMAHRASPRTRRPGSLGRREVGTRPLEGIADPGPEYIAEAEQPSEEDWDREEALYREKDENQPDSKT